MDCRVVEEWLEVQMEWLVGKKGIKNFTNIGDKLDISKLKKMYFKGKKIVFSIVLYLDRKLVFMIVKHLT